MPASRNMDEPLQAAGVRGLFDVEVDGRDAEALRLEGASGEEGGRRREALTWRKALT